ncbi:hypothetical protein [uncultured Parasutterella sp.]|uniref:hypothetical protein n=1 Tax=uncultured Parasutterella sp. TaxID=1263098 RepID=UPI002592ABD2|nr:hypothetical protein [uncultured Parasutterella sp.]
MSNSDLLDPLDEVKRFLSDLSETDRSHREKLLGAIYQLKQKMLALDNSLTFDDSRYIKRLTDYEAFKRQSDEQAAIEESFRRPRRRRLNELRKRQRAERPPKVRAEKKKPLPVKKTEALPPQQTWLSGLSS